MFLSEYCYFMCNLSGKFKDAVKSVLRISSARNKGGPADINIAQILHLSNFFELKQSLYSFKPGAHTAILVGRFRFRWMFSVKTISDRICGLIYIATFANIIHLNLKSAD